MVSINLNPVKELPAESIHSSTDLIPPNLLSIWLLETDEMVPSSFRLKLRFSLIPIWQSAELSWGEFYFVSKLFFNSFSYCVSYLTWVQHWLFQIARYEETQAQMKSQLEASQTQLNNGHVQVWCTSVMFTFHSQGCVYLSVYLPFTGMLCTSPVYSC